MDKDTLGSFLDTCIHTFEEQEALYKKALLENTFESLMNYPCMLFYWQRHHQEDAKRIATLNSHILGNRYDVQGNHIKGHLWCDTKEKCQAIQKSIEDHKPGQSNFLT